MMAIGIIWGKTGGQSRGSGRRDWRQRQMPQMLGLWDLQDTGPWQEPTAQLYGNQTDQKKGLVQQEEWGRGQGPRELMASKHKRPGGCWPGDWSSRLAP